MFKLESWALSKIPFYRHDLGQPELDEIAKVLAQPVLTTGDFVEEFERRFAHYLNAGHVIGVSSCTGALHMALLAMGIGPGDEVITTPLTFIATAAAIWEAGASVVFVDVEPHTGNLDATAIAAAVTPRTKAIMPVHLYGQMCDMVAIRREADRFGLKIIEDCAHCVEGERDGIRPGQLSDAACFSFFATKNLACGEGGALACNDADMASRFRLLRLHGMDKTSQDRYREGYRHWDMVELGWKYNMSNIEAAMLLPQFNRLAAKLERRRQLAGRYDELLSGVAGIRRPDVLPGTHARHLYTVWVEDRDRVLAELAACGVECVVNYRAIHLLSYPVRRLGHRPGDFPVAEAIGDRCLSLPFYPSMPEDFVDQVCERLVNIVTGRIQPDRLP